MGNPTRPIGHETYGITTRNRVRRVDIFLIRHAPNLLKRQDGQYKSAFYVDIGFGHKPMTTIERASHFRKLNPDLPVLGVEIDPERVSAAQSFQAKSVLRFEQKGFPIDTRKKISPVNKSPREEKTS